MAAAVARVLAEGGHLLVEAGTGTGKSFAYLIPLLCHAALSGEKVVVSTATIALQEQILRKDLPLLQELLPARLEAVLVKGKGHYLCRWRLEREQQATLFPEEGWHELCAWARETTTGDGAEVEGTVPAALWARVAADETCHRPFCPYQEDCFFLAARERAARAAVLVVNHHLYLSDLRVRLAGGGDTGVLPEHRVAVFDEAHHLPAVAAGAFTVEVGFPRFAALGRSLRLLRPPGLDLGRLEALEETAAAFFAALSPAGSEEDNAWPLTTYPLSLATKLRQYLRDLARHVSGLSGAKAAEKEAAERLAREAERLAQELQFILQGEEGYVSWVQATKRLPVLQATPLEVGDLLGQYLFGRLESSVLTSATLSLAGDFGFFRQEVGLATGPELCLPSPFAFQEQCLLYLPLDLPEPNDPDFYAAAVPRIATLLDLSRGRALVLFTSYRALRQAYDYLAPRLPYPLLCQGEQSRQTLLHTFRQEIASVLLATASFWEGVDVPGEALSCLIIDRLPFAVPGHPVTEARLAAIRAAGGNAFFHYSLPQAILRLKQGFGRLIRHRRDRGVVAILDRRLTAKAYGRLFLAALPPCPRTHALEEVRRFFET